MVLIAPSGKLHVASSTGAMPLARSAKLLRAVSAAVPAPVPRKRTKVATPSQESDMDAVDELQLTAASTGLSQSVAEWSSEETLTDSAVVQLASKIEPTPMDLPMQSTQELPSVVAATTTVAAPFVIEQLPLGFDDDYLSNGFWA